MNREPQCCVSSSMDEQIVEDSARSKVRFKSRRHSKKKSISPGPSSKRNKRNKNKKKQLKWSFKSVKGSISYEYQMKSCMTWEYADTFSDISNWHESLKDEDVKMNPIEIKSQLKNEETINHISVNGCLVENINSDDQQNRNSLMIEDAYTTVDWSTTNFNNNIMEYFPTPIYRQPCNVRQKVSIDKSAETDDDSSSIPTEDKCNSVTSEETTKSCSTLSDRSKVEGVSRADGRAPTCPRFNCKSSINNISTKELANEDDSQVKVFEVNKDPIYQETGMLGHEKLRNDILNNSKIEMLEQEELFSNSLSNRSTDQTKSNSDKRQHINLNCVKSSFQRTGLMCPDGKNKKSFKCHDCEKEFSRRYSLKLHLHTHSGEKPFRCTYCPKKFSAPSNLESHLRTHTGEKPYKCTECPKMFSKRGNLMAHQRTHSGEKPYKCTECQRMFSLRGNLIAHQRTHSGEKPYKCKECPQEFSQRASLTTHQRTHSGEKPYKCTECPKMFSQSGHLTTHLYTHLVEKP